MYILSTTVSEIFKDDILWLWIGVEVFLFSSMFIVEQQGSETADVSLVTGTFTVDVLNFQE